MGQVAQSLRFLRLNKIIHLDLKPDNILLSKNFSIKLIDFGEAFHPDSYETSNYKNILESIPSYSFPYGCPELVQGCRSFT